VVHSVSFGYEDVDTWQAVALGREPGHIYSRNTNPTVRAFEEKIRDLEAAEAATSFSSGMAAISGTLFAFLRPADRVVSIRDSYGGTNKLFSEFLPSFGIEVRLCATSDFEHIEAEVARGCKLLYLETPTNPTVKIVDIERLALAPMDAYHLLRGMKTLALRVERQNHNALTIARWLQEQSVVEHVNYPGLETHPHHDVAKRQMRGFGGMLSFSVRGEFEAIKQVLPRFRYAHRAANLGCVETVVGPPAVTSHVECTAEERAAAGIPEGLIRYSTGIEDVSDLIADLSYALAVCSERPCQANTSRGT